MKEGKTEETTVRGNLSQTPGRWMLQRVSFAAFCLDFLQSCVTFISGWPDSYFLEGWAARSNLGETWASWLHFCHEEDVAEPGLPYGTEPCSLDAGLVTSLHSKRG